MTPKPTTGAPALHVAVTGRDRASGSSSAPLRTIGAAIAKSQAGGTVVVHSGSYHEELKVENRKGLQIVAAPSAKVWLDGSSRVTGWSRQGTLWVRSNWDVEFDASPTYDWGMRDNKAKGWRFVSSSHPMAAHPDQVWVAGKRQRQVGSKREVGRGDFYVDYAAGKLYLGADPTGRTVRASTLTQALRIRSAETVLRGIGVRRFAPSVPHMGAVTVEAPRVMLDDLIVADNATTGVHVMDKDVRLQDVTVANNGMMGLSATHADGLVLDRLVARRNNLERFNSAPAAGGVKIGRSVDVTVRDSRFTDNLGTGLWFDESVRGVGVFGSELTDNAAHGLSLELSGMADIANNVFADNEKNGVKVNDSDDVRIWNNTFVQNNRAVNVVQDDRDLDPQGSYRDTSLPLTWQNRNVAIRNNIFVGSRGDCLVCVEDYSGRFSAQELNVTADGNLYHRPGDRSPRWLVVWSRGPREAYVFADVGEFRSTVNQETTGLLVTEPPLRPSTYASDGAVLRAGAAVAQPMPEDLAARVGVSAAAKHLGAWRD